LRSKIASQISNVDLTFEDSKLVLTSKNGKLISVGAMNDTSNFNAIVGLSGTDSTIKSSRELYCANTGSVLTTSGLFRAGNVTAGTFTIGDETFTITNTTTLGDLVSQINNSENSQATAYWDSVSGKLVLTSKVTGASLLNIEAGTSNFTDIMGLTSTSSSNERKLNISTQELGSNAKFTINGTNYTSTSNTVGSDITRIEGLTLNLKGISASGNTTTITVEKDSESLSSALSDIVDAYNDLLTNVDSEIATGSNLSDQSTLRLIRNQIRNLMTSSSCGNSVFRNLSAIGISLSAASNGNIDTSKIDFLTFDKEAFTKAYSTDSDALKSLLVGTEDSKGVLMQVEDVVEQALASVTGYFAIADKSYETQLSNLDSKITKANASVAAYQSRLENKFALMDTLISKMQNQYSSFLSS
jgi:flagellar hook-associated protein 2